MCKLNEKYESNRNISKDDYIRNPPSEISTINTANCQIFINKPKEDSVISLINIYLDLNFDVLYAATVNRYVEDNDIRLVNLGPVASFNIYRLTTSSGNNLEKISHALFVCLMYKLITSARGTDDLSIGFDRSHHRRQRELTSNKNIKGKHHVSIYLKDIFGFAEHQEKGTFGLGYRLTLTKNTDNSVLNKDNETNNAKIKINAIGWFVAHYTPSLEQHNILMNQIIKKMATELQYPERSVFLKEVNTQNFGLLNWEHKKAYGYM